MPDDAPHPGQPDTETALATGEGTDDRERWIEEDLAPLPPRPRRRLLAPAPLLLIAILLTACGFIAGVLVEKGQNGSSAGASSGASGFAARLRGLGGSRAGSAGATGGAPGGAGSATVGTVSYLSGATLYVTSGEGNTIKVKTSSATSVTKNVRSAVHAIHPGEAVTVTGSAASDGTVTASAIRVGTQTLALGALLGGAGASGGTGAGGGSGASSRSSEGPALFGAG